MKYRARVYCNVYLRLGARRRLEVKDGVLLVANILGHGEVRIEIL
jgi:hypothetical protein